MRTPCVLGTIIAVALIVAIVFFAGSRARAIEHMTDTPEAAATAASATALTLENLDERYKDMDSSSYLTHYMTTLAGTVCTDGTKYTNQIAPDFPFTLVASDSTDKDTCTPDRYIALNQYTSVLGPPSNACKPSTSRYTVMITLQHDVPVRRACLFRIIGGNMDVPHEIALYVTPMLQDGGGNKQYLVQAVHGTATCDSQSATCTSKTLDSLGDNDYTYFLTIEDDELTVHRYHSGVLQLAVKYTSITKFEYTSTVPMQINYGNALSGKLFSFGIFDTPLKEATLHNVAKHCHLYMQTVTNETVRSLFEQNVALRARLAGNPFTPGNGVDAKCPEVTNWSDLSTVVSASQDCRSSIVDACVADPTSSAACVCWDQSRTVYASDQCAGLRAVMRGGVLRDINDLQKTDLDTIRTKYALCPVAPTVPATTTPTTTPATTPVAPTPKPSVPKPSKPAKKCPASPKKHVREKAPAPVPVKRSTSCAVADTVRDALKLEFAAQS